MNDLVVVCVVEISARPSEFSFVLFVSLIITRDGEPYTSSCIQYLPMIIIPRAAAGRKKKTKTKTIKRNDFLFLFLLILNEFIRFSFFIGNGNTGIELCYSVVLLLLLFFLLLYNVK